jgi:uncharacterized protein (DUF433 family)
VRGTPIPVALVLHYLAEGMSHQEILACYESLTDEDILACLRYAADSLKPDAENEAHAFWLHLRSPRRAWGRGTARAWPSWYGSRTC